MTTTGAAAAVRNVLDPFAFVPRNAAYRFESTAPEPLVVLRMSARLPETS